jgi:hypothetical protein
MFRSRFPELEEVAVERTWSGPISISLDFLPSIGRTGKGQNIYYAIGCAGHGVAMMSHLGAQLAGMVLHGEPGPAALTTRRRIPMPPEPIRWLVAKGIMRGLAALDRRTDSRAQPRAGKEPAALEEAEREPAETV